MKSFYYALLSLFAPLLHAENIDVYFGTGGGQAKGIYHAMFDAESGSVELLATALTLSPAMKVASDVHSGSEVLVHPNGRYVYGANRGHDSVTGFQIDSEMGHLYVIDNEPIRGAWPRNINMDATGEWLLAAGAR